MYNNFNANVERTIPVSPYLWTYVLPESGTIPVFLNNMDISGGEHPDSIPTSDFGRDLNPALVRDNAYFIAVYHSIT